MADQQDDQQLNQLRSIILKDDDARVISTVKQHARDIVSDVITESIHDREKQDHSISTILTPIVENSVERSITNQRDRFIGYLYPLMGSLVRKYVSSFLNEILEKTNKIIENSFTYKGLKWRWQAKKAGVSFAQYVVSQTYLFRVEQVFLIHAETGLLLNAVALDADKEKDADLISSMLSAINDFVADSFTKSAQNNEGVDTIKTAHFTLVIKNGPLAIIAAAVTGNMPEEVPKKLQYSLEQIHQLYNHELQNFTGESTELANTEQLLRDCLITKIKSEQQPKGKKPWYAVIVFTLLLGGSLYYGLKPDNVAQQLSKLNDELGISVDAIQKQTNGYYRIKIWRDPAAINIKDWLVQQNINPDKIVISEQAFISAEPQLTQKKIATLLAKYQLSAQEKENRLVLQGRITYTALAELKVKLLNLLNETSLDTSQLQLIDLPNIEHDAQNIQRALLNEKLAQIATLQINFARANAELNALAKQQIQVQAINIKEAFKLAKQINVKLGILIIGTSDNQGTKLGNIEISKERAAIVKAALISNGVDATRLYALGIGEIKIPSVSNEARKVIFSRVML